MKLKCRHFSFTNKTVASLSPTLKSVIPLGHHLWSLNCIFTILFVLNFFYKKKKSLIYLLASIEINVPDSCTKYCSVRSGCRHRTMRSLSFLSDSKDCVIVWNCTSEGDVWRPLVDLRWRGKVADSVLLASLFLAIVELLAGCFWCSLILPTCQDIYSVNS